MIIATRDDISEMIMQLRHLDLTVPWEVTWRRLKNNRTLEQNRLHWRIVRAICAKTGDDVIQMHERLLMSCFGFIEEDIEIYLEDGPRTVTVTRAIRRSKDLSVAQFAAFNEWCLAHAAIEYDVYIPTDGDAIMETDND